MHASFVLYIEMQITKLIVIVHLTENISGDIKQDQDMSTSVKNNFDDISSTANLAGSSDFDDLINLLTMHETDVDYSRYVYTMNNERMSGSFIITDYEYSSESEGSDYTKVELLDFCGFRSIQIDDACEISDSIGQSIQSDEEIHKTNNRRKRMRKKEARK